MITEYILFLLFLPAVIFWKIEFTDRFDEERLLDNKDTISLRGMSAFFVIAAHYMAWVDELIGHTTNGIVKSIVGQLGGIGVLVFFFVSGFGIYESYGNRKVDKYYLLKRIKSVYLPYVIMKIILLLVEYTIFQSTESVVMELILIITIEDWFIHVIVIQYIIFFVAAKIKKKNVIVISILADCILTIIYVYMNKPINWFNALWLFTFGMIISKYHNNVMKAIEKYYFRLLGVFLISFGLSGFVFALNKGVAWANIFKPISGMFLCMSICFIIRKCRLKSGVLIWAGNRSMYLYIAHKAIWKYLESVGNLSLRLWGALVVSLFVAELFYRVSRLIMDASILMKKKILDGEKKVVSI